MRRLSNQHGAFQSEASITTRRLGQAEMDLAALRATLHSERALREQVDRAVEALKRELASEKDSFKEIKGEANVAKEARRRSESQVSFTQACVKRAFLGSNFGIGLYFRR